MRRLILVLGLAAATAIAVPQGASTVERKLEAIEKERVPRGSTVTLSEEELNGYIRKEVGSTVSEGVRETRLELGEDRASGSAYIDFAKLRRAVGQPLNPMAAWLFGGEHPVRVDARIKSGGGTAQVDVERVEVEGIAITGRTLDWVIRNYVTSYFPDAKIGRPFELAHGIDRLEVRPSRVNVVMEK